MVAHAKAHESKKNFGAFEKRADVEASKRFVGSFSGYERNVLFTRSGEGYLEAGFAYGLDLDHDGRAVAPLDYDGDGDQDLVIVSLQGISLLQNESPAGRWLRLRLKDARGGLALGAVVRVITSEGTQVDRARITAGFHTQVDPELHFGLGGAKLKAVEVSWPGGETQRFEGLKASQRYQLTEGGEAQPRPLPRWPAESLPRPIEAYSLRNQAMTLEGGMRPLGGVGKVAVLNFWAPWCAACERELPQLIELQKKHPEVSVVAVSAETKDLANVKAFAERLKLHSLDLRVANDEVIGSFFGAEGKLSLPATFVFDRLGRLRRSWFREIDAKEVSARLKGLEGKASLEDHRSLAEVLIKDKKLREARQVLDAARADLGEDPEMLLHIGRLYLNLSDHETGQRMLRRAIELRPDEAAAWSALGEALGARGDLDGAEKAIRKALSLEPRHALALNNMGMVHLGRGRRAEAIKAFAAALEVDPTLRQAQLNLERTRAQ